MMSWKEGRQRERLRPFFFRERKGRPRSFWISLAREESKTGGRRRWWGKKEAERRIQPSLPSPSDDATFSSTRFFSTSFPKQISYPIVTAGSSNDCLKIVLLPHRFSIIF